MEQLSCSNKPSDANNWLRSLMSEMKANQKNITPVVNNTTITDIPGNFILCDTVPDGYSIRTDLLGYFIKEGSTLTWMNDSNNANHTHGISTPGMSLALSYVTGRKSQTRHRQDHKRDDIYLSNYRLTDSQTMGYTTSSAGSEYKPRSFTLIPAQRTT